MHIIKSWCTKAWLCCDLLAYTLEKRLFSNSFRQELELLWRGTTVSQRHSFRLTAMKLISEIFHENCDGDGKMTPDTLRSGPANSGGGFRKCQHEMAGESRLVSRENG